MEDDRTAAESAEEALTAAAAEVELAFHDSRLRGAVADAVSALKISAAGSSAGASGEGGGGGSAAAEAAEAAAAAVREAAASAAAALQSSVKGEVVAAVDTLCSIAGDAPTVPSGGGSGDGEAPAATATASAARDALDALIGFAGSGDGPVAARRAAVAFVGGAGDAAGAAGLEAVAAVFRGDKSPGVRRTAGDALR